MMRRFSVEDLSAVAEARREALVLAHGLELDETESGRLALLVTEAATNLLKHAGGGELLMGVLGEERSQGVEVLALDRGAGMPDVEKCSRDGFSTSGSPGNGLGAMARLSSLFDIYSLPSLGTAVLLRLLRRKQAPLSRPEAGLELGIVSLPKPGEEVCGDACAVEERQGSTYILMADGLGHGPDAARAAQEAVKVFRQRDRLEPADLLAEIHLALQHTRGAAAAVARVDTRRGMVTFAGLGNIGGVIIGPGASRSMVSQNGTLGHQARRIQEFSYAWPDEGLLILHSDGLGSRFSVDRYPGLIMRHPGLTAGVLYRDFSRRTDDVTVLVARLRAA
jgi:anti-sigma regulatory factor (Ser/Thr protein kinase)